MRRIAVIFDNQTRPDTTGIYCRRALARLAEVEHFLPAELSRIEHDKFDLYVNVDDGLRYRLPPDLRPAVWWAIDTHLDLPWYVEKGQDFDLVFAAQRDGAAALRQFGLPAQWLPLACDEELHRPYDVPVEFDVCFVGHLFPGARKDLVDLIQQTFSRSFVGQRFFDDMARTYSASRVVFNRSLRNDVNMRVFETLGCGGFLLTNDLQGNGQAELFRDGEHFATYTTAPELLDKLKYYLAHDDLRRGIAEAGRREALAKHTYFHRMQRLLEAAQSLGKGRRQSRVIPAATAPVGKRGAWWADLLSDGARNMLLLTAEEFGTTDHPDEQAPVAVRVARVGSQARSLSSVARPADLSALADSGQFDAVVCDRFLETVQEPLAWLRAVREIVKLEGSVIGRVLSAASAASRNALADGDASHPCRGWSSLTPREVEKLLYRAHLAADRWEMRNLNDEGTQGTPGSATGDRETGSEADQECLFSATLRPRSAWPLTSIVIVTHNQWAHTTRCLESIVRHTDEPYELIVVDNGSTDETREKLRWDAGVRLIANASNRGFPAAANQGLAAARGEFLLLLNNDTLATTGWLRRQLDALASDPGIGLVGPVSNCVSGEQQIPVTYQRMESLDGFAWEWGRRHSGRRVDTDRLVGFCLLTRREVVDRVGVLDEQFGIGNFEDDDFCRRVLQAGYRAVIAVDAFVHHVGGQTFRASSVDFEQLMQQNRRLYEAKWAGQARVDSVFRTRPEPPTISGPVHTPRFKIEESARGGLVLRRIGDKLSLCMIVRDNAATIGPALESIQPWVDEIVVVDTGSTDLTPEICQRYGARLFEFPWCDDFSAARNESVRHARGEWIFWMDSDDTITPECGEHLRRLADGPHPEDVLGYVMQVHCPGGHEQGAPNVTVVDHVKLFRNRPDLRFEGRIHEQLLPSIRRAGGEVAWSDIFVVHSGSDQSESGRRRKVERDLRILHQELIEKPDHPFVLFNLGMTYADDRRHDEAIGYLSRSIAVATPGESHLRKAYALLVNAYSQSGQFEEARRSCEEGHRLFPDDKELLFRTAMLHQHFGKLEEAARVYLQVLEGAEERHFSSIDRGLSGFKARNNLALVYDEMGRLPDAEGQWRQILKEVPEFRPAWQALGELLLRQKRLGDVAQLVADLRTRPEFIAEATCLEARLREREQRPGEALELLRTTLHQRPADLLVRQELCRLAFEFAPPQEAVTHLEQLRDQIPDDPATWHNLGMVYARLRRYDQAVAAYGRSLALRPGANATRELLELTVRERELQGLSASH